MRKLFSPSRLEAVPAATACAVGKRPGLGRDGPGDEIEPIYTTALRISGGDNLIVSVPPAA